MAVKDPRPIGQKPVEPPVNCYTANLLPERENLLNYFQTVKLSDVKNIKVTFEKNTEEA
jgi:hypothetical protein